ncbi:MAG: sigma-70 family RNA polymerase sigma factor, partial [Acidobacteriota bacterium]
MPKPETSNREEPTVVLLDQVRAGSDTARERLMERFLPILRRWARGRLPSYARSAAETDDLVQVTLLRALGNVARFDPRGEGAFLAYLRQIMLNAVRDEIRRSGRRPPHDPVDREVADSGP